MYDRKTSKRIKVRYYEDLACSLKFEKKDCDKGRISKRSYKVTQGCGTNLIKYQPREKERHFVKRTNKKSSRCKSWLPNSDNHFTCGGGNWVVTCTAHRPFITAKSRIRMKNGGTYKF